MKIKYYKSYAKKTSVLQAELFSLKTFKERFTNVPQNIAIVTFAKRSRNVATFSEEK